MPNLDGTGPQGQGAMTGSRRGRCRNLHSQNIQSTKQTGEIKEVLGVGRGGRPLGGGQGNCYGGNERKGQGKRFGN
jgi:hypothetical protein